MMTNDQALVQGLYINQAHPKHGYYQIIHMFMFNVLFYILSSFYVKLYKNPLIDRFQDKLWAWYPHHHQWKIKIKKAFG